MAAGASPPTAESLQGCSAWASLRSRPDELIGNRQEFQIEVTMLYSQSPPLAGNETAEENSPRGFARDEEARSEPRFGRRPGSIYALPPPRRRSIVGRMFRAVTRFVIVVLIGVGATLGWQAYGDMAKAMLAAYAPEQAWLLSYLPATKPPAAVAAAPSSPAVQLQLEPLASNLEFVRRSVEQLALKQDQMLRNIAALQALDEDIRLKVWSPPPSASAAQAAMPQPQPKPPKLQPPPGAPAAPRPSASGAPVSLAPTR